MSPIVQGIAIGTVLAAAGRISLSSCRTAIHHVGTGYLLGRPAFTAIALIAGLGFFGPDLTLLFPTTMALERTATAGLGGLLTAGVLCGLRQLHRARRTA